MTNDLKSLLRLGIPISQRCSVWKAIVDHKLMRVQNDKFEANYYKKLLANYNPGQKLTSAAKQVRNIYFLNTTKPIKMGFENLI